MPKLVAGNAGSVKAETLTALKKLVTEGRELVAKGGSAMEVEQFVARRMSDLSRLVLAYLFALMCRQATEKDLEARGLSPAQVRLRGDAKDGYISVHSTFGPLRFPNFSYRDFSPPVGCVVRSPWREVFPYHKHSRSTPLSLQWEARLGAQFPFRKAEEMAKFFSRGAATIEDTSIAAHMLALSHMVESSWLYVSPEKIREVLTTRATRDKRTGRPLIYMSSDAHALRRYVGATWDTEWKMVNGIRLWCEDARTGQIIHLGGEFLWEDCRGVEARIRTLVETGVLPDNDEAWTEVNAQVVFISDGAEWLVTNIPTILPHDTIFILDPYHALEWIGEALREIYGKNSPETKKRLAEARRRLFNKCPRSHREKGRLRRGHKKTRGVHKHHTHRQRWAGRGRPRTTPGDATASALLDWLAELKYEDKPASVAALEKLVDRICNNVLRMDYPVYLARGMQIGSGAMESLHRNGSQKRTKLPGAKWGKESSLAVLRFRMLELAGRWDEFWNRPTIATDIESAFISRAQERAAERLKHPTEEAA